MIEEDASAKEREKASSAIVCNEEGRYRFSRATQEEKALRPIDRRGEGVVAQGGASRHGHRGETFGEKGVASSVFVEQFYQGAAFVFGRTHKR